MIALIEIFDLRLRRGAATWSSSQNSCLRGLIGHHSIVGQMDEFDIGIIGRSRVQPQSVSGGETVVGVAWSGRDRLRCFDRIRIITFSRAVQE